MTTATGRTGPATRTRWVIDPAHSSIEFSARHMMITTVKGRFEQFTGSVLVDEANPDNSAAEVDIEASSLNTGSDQRDNHLRSADFLDVANHPTITFRSTRVEGAYDKPSDQFVVYGTLTIRGASREVMLDVVYEGRGKDPWGGERASFSAVTKIDRREFGLTWNQALETGGILVSNDIRISLEVQFVKQQ